MIVGTLVQSENPAVLKDAAFIFMPSRFGVNGQTGNPLVVAWQNWLMDQAVGPMNKKVGNMAV